MACSTALNNGKFVSSGEWIGGGGGMLKGIAINLKDIENKPDFSHQSCYFIATPHIW
jgi:hypothetical protein